MLTNHENEQNKKKPMPPAKMFLISFFGILGSLLPVLILMSVFGNVNFLEALINTAIGVAIFSVGFIIFLYVIVDKWWDKLEWKTQEKLRNMGVGMLLISFLVLWPLGMFGGSSWGGLGSVNLFPSGADSKNYRVNAEMTVHPKLFWQREYTIDSVEWPNGGTSYFSNCEVTKDNKLCEDDEGRKWTVEIATNPEYDGPDDY
jgi:amino acid transporter